MSDSASLCENIFAQNFSSLSRFGNDANQFFNMLLSLGDSEIEVIKIGPRWETSREHLQNRFRLYS